MIDSVIRDDRDLVREVKAESPDVADLATVASLASRVEAHLLRTLRLRILPKSHAGTEGDLWLGPLVESRSQLGFVLRPSVAEVLRSELATRRDWLASARELVQAAHHGASPSTVLEEEIIWLVLDGGPDDPRISRALRRALKAMVDDEKRAVDLATWALRALPRLPTSIQRTDAAWLLAMAAGSRLEGRTIFEGDAPAGVQAVLPSVLRPGIEPVSIGARWTPDGLELTYPPDPRAYEIEVPETDPILLTVERDGAAEPDDVVSSDRDRDVVEGLEDRIRANGDPRRTPITLRRERTVVVDVAPDVRELKLHTGDGATVALRLSSADVTMVLTQSRSDVQLGELSVQQSSETDSPPIAEFEALRERARESRMLDSISGATEYGEQLAKLLPRQFWGTLRGAYDFRPSGLPRVQVITDIPGIAWHLAVVQGTRFSSGSPFLGSQVDLAVWQRSPRSAAKPVPLAVDVSMIVATFGPRDPATRTRGDAVDSGLDEANFIRDKFGARVSDPDAGAFGLWLRGELPADVVHFAGGGRRDPNTGESQIVLAEFSLTGELVPSLAPGISGLVVLDADEAASGHLVEGFLDAGAAGVIAAIGRTGGPSAQRFFEELYLQILNGTPIATALGDLQRRAFVEGGAVAPLPLGFQWFGHPGTKMVLRDAAFIWDLDAVTPPSRLIGHGPRITSVDVSDDGDTIATGGEDGTVRIWSRYTRRERFLVEHGFPVTAVALAPGGFTVAIGGSDGSVLIAPIDGPDPVQLPFSYGSPVGELAWTHDGLRLAVMSEEGAVGAVDVGGSFSSRQDVRFETRCIAWSPDGRLFGGLADGRVAVIEGPDQGRQSRRRGAPVIAIAVSTDGSRLATASEDGTIATMDAVSLDRIGDDDRTDEPVIALRSVPAGWIGVTDDGRVLTWDASGTEIPGGRRIVVSGRAALAADGTFAVTFGDVSPDVDEPFLDEAPASSEFAFETESPATS